MLDMKSRLQGELTEYATESDRESFLAKLNGEDPGLIDVFECIIGGMEVAPAYSEQNSYGMPQKSPPCGQMDPGFRRHDEKVARPECTHIVSPG